MCQCQHFSGSAAGCKLTGTTVFGKAVYLDQWHKPTAATVACNIEGTEHQLILYICSATRRWDVVNTSASLHTWVSGTERQLLFLCKHDTCDRQWQIVIDKCCRLQNHGCHNLETASAIVQKRIQLCHSSLDAASYKLAAAIGFKQLMLSYRSVCNLVNHHMMLQVTR